MHEANYRFGDVEVEAAGREVRKGGERVALEPKALDVLLLLLAEAGKVVEKRRLLREVWADVHVTDSSLARAVTQVRRALGDDIRTPRFIETVPTRGYRFIGQLANGAAEAPVQPPALPPVRRQAWSPLLGGGLAVVALAVGGWAWHVARSQAAPSDLGSLLLASVSQTAMQVTTSRGLDVDPALSPDGNAIAYASDGSGSLEILVRPRAGNGNVRAITDNQGDNVEPAWSPDGQWVAFHSRRFGGIWVAPSAGGPVRQVVIDGASPTWSPDGAWIAYQTAGEADVLGGAGGSASTLALVNVSTGEVRSLTRPGDPPGTHGNPVWVPGHQTIVFVAVRVPAAEVWQVTRDGRTTRLGGCHATCRPFAFRHGGRTWVGAVRGAKAGQLWLAPVGDDGVVESAHASLTPLPRTQAVSDVSLSADGRYVAFTNAERTSEAWSLDLPGGDPLRASAPRVLLGERRPRYSEFAFSPDGTRLAYTTSRLGDRPEPWVLDIGSGVSRPLGAVGFVKGWAPGGRDLALVGTDHPLEIQRLDMVTGRTSPLLAFGTWTNQADSARRVFTLRLSPDFRRYFFTGSDDARSGVWLGSVDGRAAPFLVAGGASFGAWSSSGRQLAVQHQRGWRSSVAVAREDGGALRPLVTDADHAWPNGWSPDDRYIVYAAMRAGRWAIEVVEVASGRVVPLTSPGAAGEYVRWPVWSPRADRVVYERGYWTGNVWVAELPVR